MWERLYLDTKVRHFNALFKCLKLSTTFHPNCQSGLSRDVVHRNIVKR